MELYRTCKFWKTIIETNRGIKTPILNPNQMPKTLIELTPEQKKKAREESKKLFGRANMTLFIQYLINQYKEKK